ncbi:MAG: alanine--tRNA ligase-related protein [Candidatus Dojkabacteria bacterium]|nr:MAG: alanine--tRNA ligase-related protein [Candidatus Dojkabacteria bacterium]
MSPTTLLYMEDSYLLQQKAKIIGMDKSEDGRDLLFLDHTVFYPQGGGSPYDQGWISSDNGKFDVEEVRFKDGLVHHIGKYSSGSFTVGEQVNLLVDEQRRLIINKLQSAGHLIDIAMRNVGYAHFRPTKGFHFPEGASVEYEGTIEPEEREAVKVKLQEELDKMIASGYEVKTRMANANELPNLCYVTPSALPEGKPIRIVAVWDDLFMPCGAPHVKNISELVGLRVTKVKCKGGSTKVSYEIE